MNATAAADAVAATGDRSAWAIKSVLAAAVLVGIALRVHFVDSGLWFDEIVTLVDSVRMPLAHIVTHFPGNNDHPLYSVLARLSIVAFGEHPWSLRLPAVIFGVAALPMLYVFGSQVAGRFEAVAATLLLAISYHHIWFSQNARGYTILLFCALLATRLLVIGLRENRRAAYVGFGVVSALAAYTHLTMVLFVLGQALVVACHLLARRGGRVKLNDWFDPALGFALAAVLTFILYAPLLMDVQKFFGAPASGPRVATTGWAILETLRGLRLGYATSGAVVLGGALFLIGSWSYFRQSPLVLALFFVPGAVLLAATILLQRPTFPRFFFFLAGFALLIIVRGIVVASIWTARLLARSAIGARLGPFLPAASIAAAAVISLLALPSNYRYPKQDYEGALGFLNAHASTSDVVVLAGIGATVPFQKYYKKAWPRLASADELTAARSQSDPWLVYTFRQYVEALEPSLMREIVTHCPVVKTFPGTLAGGSIVVTRCRAVARPQ